MLLSIFGTKYSGMDQVKFALGRLSSANFTWSILEYFVPFYHNLLKTPGLLLHYFKTLDT